LDPISCATPEQEKLFSVVWNGKNQTGKDIPTGIYFYKITNDKKVETGKMLLLK